MKTPYTDSIEPLNELLAMSLSERIAAVCKDLATRKDVFRRVDPFDLAQALGVPEAETPACGWRRTQFAERRSVEAHAECVSPISEIVYLLEGGVSAERFAILERTFAGMDADVHPTFEFLTKHERELIEEAIVTEDLESNASNGMNCLAHYTVATNAGPGLRFEALLEGDGSCVVLRTPYDERDGKFTNLEHCLTTSWRV